MEHTDPLQPHSYQFQFPTIGIPWRIILMPIVWHSYLNELMNKNSEKGLKTGWGEKPPLSRKINHVALNFLWKERSGYLLKTIKLEPFCVARGTAAKCLKPIQDDLPSLPIKTAFRKPFCMYFHGYFNRMYGSFNCCTSFCEGALH